MTFKDTIYKLLEETEEIEVIACRAYPENGMEIGIRRHTIYDHTMKDPIIDGIPFMICGTILKDFENINCKTITNLEDVIYESDDRITVELYAISIPELINRTDLGYYKVLKMEFIEESDKDILYAVKLYLKRKT